MVRNQSMSSSVTRFQRAMRSMSPSKALMSLRDGATGDIVSYCFNSFCLLCLICLLLKRKYNNERYLLSINII